MMSATKILSYIVNKNSFFFSLHENKKNKMVETHQQTHDNALSDLTFQVGIIVFMLAISVTEEMRGELWKANLLFLIVPAIGILYHISIIFEERRGLQMGRFRFRTLAEKDAYLAHVRELERQSKLERDNDELLQEIDNARKSERRSAGSAFPSLPDEIRLKIFQYKRANTKKAEKRFSDAAQESAAALRAYKYAETFQWSYNHPDLFQQTLEAKTKADATYKAAYGDLMKDRYGR